MSVRELMCSFAATSSRVHSLPGFSAISVANVSLVDSAGLSASAPMMSFNCRSQIAADSWCNSGSAEGDGIDKIDSGKIISVTD